MLSRERLIAPKDAPTQTVARPAAGNVAPAVTVPIADATTAAAPDARAMTSHARWKRCTTSHQQRTADGLQDAATKIASPATKQRLRPTRSANRPAGTSSAAKTIA